MAVQFYAIIPVTPQTRGAIVTPLQTRGAAAKPLQNAVALVFDNGVKFMSFRPKTGWVRSGPADSDTVIGYGDDIAVKVEPAAAVAILQRLDPAASLPA